MDADVDKRLAVHEAICAERYNSIEKSLRSGDKRMTKIEYLLYVVILAVLLGPGVAADVFKKIFGIWHVGLGWSIYCRNLSCGLCNLLHVHNCMELGVVNALAYPVTTVGASWSRSQEWLSCARVLVNCLDNPQPVRAPSADVHVADKQCIALPISRLCGNMEQLVRVGWRGGFSRA